VKVDVGPLIKMLSLRPTGDLGPYTFYTRYGVRSVFFPRTQPSKPPSPQQTCQRYRWAALARQWQATPPTAKAAWEKLCHDNHLRITALNLFIHYYSRPDLHTIDTLLSHSTVTTDDLFQPFA
jgi:hypothetical protein